MLLYHLVFPAKYRRNVFTEDAGELLKENCFVEIGMEGEHVYFLVQSVSTIAVSEIVMTVKSITAKEIFKSSPYIKQEILWGGALWTSGFYTNTVRIYASKDTIMRYI